MKIKPKLFQRRKLLKLRAVNSKNSTPLVGWYDFAYANIANVLAALALATFSIVTIRYNLEEQNKTFLTYPTIVLGTLLALSTAILVAMPVATIVNRFVIENKINKKSFINYSIVTSVLFIGLTLLYGLLSTAFQMPLRNDMDIDKIKQTLLSHGAVLEEQKIVLNNASKKITDIYVLVNNKNKRKY